MKSQRETIESLASSSITKRSSAVAICFLPLLLLKDTHAFQFANAPSVRQLSPLKTSQFKLRVSELDKIDQDKIKEDLEKAARLPSVEKDIYNTKKRRDGNENVESLDVSTYEAMLLNSWDGDPSVQKGFDWEIEKMRRNFAGLQQTEDGTWVKRPTIFEFLVNKAEFSTATVRRIDEPPKPVNVADVMYLFLTNTLRQVGFGDALGLAKVPDVVIQKYEGSYFSFIKGVLGGDLQTLAGGPFFLLLAKYYTDYGPIQLELWTQEFPGP